jgi:rubrerythrin
MMTAAEIAHRDRMDSIRASLAQPRQPANFPCPVCGEKGAMSFSVGERPVCDAPACMYARAKVRAGKPA